MVEKGGGQARKPADLEAILGPVPQQPNMSAFSFPLNDPSQPPQAIPPSPAGAPGFAAAPPSPAARFGHGPGSQPGTGPNPRPTPPGAPPGRPGPTPPSFAGQDRTMAMGNAAPGTAPAPFPPPAAGNPAVPSGATVAATPAAGRGALPKAHEEATDEETAIGKPSDELLSASGAGATVQADGGLQEWRVVYEDFLRTKRECGEPTDGLTFEKFQQTLKKNRDALMQRHGCKRVKFSVYVKEGRASLKATPVRE